MSDGLAGLLADAASHSAESEDRNTTRIVDAALHQAAAVGLPKLTMEDVVRRSGLGRMTVYRRFPSRDELVRALVVRETQRFLAAVATGIDRAEDPADGVVEAFLAAVAFSREHPILRRVSELDAGGAAERRDDAELLRVGGAFIARELHGARRGRPSREARWVADVFARLFLSFLAVPPTDPSFSDDAQLRRFARDVLEPMAARVTRSSRALPEVP